MGGEGQDVVPFSKPQEEAQGLPGHLEGQECAPPMPQQGEMRLFSATVIENLTPHLTGDETEDEL